MDLKIQLKFYFSIVYLICPLGKPTCRMISESSITVLESGENLTPKFLYSSSSNPKRVP